MRSTFVSMREAVGPACVAAILAIAGPAAAQTPPVFNWTGFYVGAHAGYGWGDADLAPTEGPFAHPGLSVDRDSFVIGGQFGYNFQYGNFVFGPQARLSFFTGDGSVQSQLFFSPVDYGVETDWLGSLQARAGVSFGMAMIYVMGGVAGSQLEASARHDSGAGFVTYSDKKTRFGAVFGGGVEYAVTPNVSVGLLVQHYVWDGHTFNLGVNPFNEPVRVGIDSHDTTMRAEVNVRLSDARVKRDATLMARRSDGIGIYRYRYAWSTTEEVGVMAQEVMRIRPDAVLTGADGFLRVDYARLGMRATTAD
jgi:outer membrane immunogenic protein